MEKIKGKTVLTAALLFVTAAAGIVVLWNKCKKDDYITSKIPQ